MKVLLVARDMAPTKAFTKLIAGLNKQGIESIHFLSPRKVDKKPLADITELVPKVDAVILGMSAPAENAAKEILVAKEADKRGIPFGFYADTYGVQNRPYFSKMLSKAKFLFVLNKEIADGVKRDYPDLDIIASGNPVWEDFFFPAYNRTEINSKLNIPSNDDIRVIMSPGGKSAVVNILLWETVIKALYNIQQSINKLLLILCPHPGDLNNLNIYNDLVEFSRLPVKIINPSQLSASDILPGVNLVIESASTVGIEAAHLRIPVIDYFSEVALVRLEQSIGTRKWEPCELKIAAKVNEVDELSQKILALLTIGPAYVDMITRQAIVYPRPPAKGSAVKTMVDYISCLA